MGIAAHGPEITPEPDPIIQQLGPQEPKPDSWEFVKAQVQGIQPGDAARLSVFLQQYPEFRDEIITAAQTHLGNATVQRALSAGQMVGQAPTEDMRDMIDDAPPVDAATEVAPVAPAIEAAAVGVAPDSNTWESVQLRLDAEPLTSNDIALAIKGYPEFREKIITYAQDQVGADVVKEAIAIVDAPPPTSEPEPQAAPPVSEPGPTPGESPATAPSVDVEEEKQPAWISRAREWNAVHADWAAEFSALTIDALRYHNEDGAFELDPVKVAHWQSEQGLDPDGKVGPKTLEAAQELSKRAAAARGQAPEDQAELEENLANLE